MSRQRLYSKLLITFAYPCLTKESSQAKTRTAAGGSNGRHNICTGETIRRCTFHAVADVHPLRAEVFEGRLELHNDFLRKWDAFIISLIATFIHFIAITETSLFCIVRTDKIEVYGITVCIHKPLMSFTSQIPSENIQGFIPAYWPDDFQLFIQPAFPIADQPTVSA